jgi:hypothetical protein
MKVSKKPLSVCVKSNNTDSKYITKKDIDQARFEKDMIDHAFGGMSTEDFNKKYGGVK